MQISPSAPVVARPAIAGNTGPLPYIPSVYVANTYGADIRALGALKVVPNGQQATQVDVTFGSSTTAILAGKILNDTIEGVKLNHSWLESDFRHPVDFSIENVVNVLKGAKLAGSDGVSTFGLNGTGSIVVWAKDDAARDHLDALLQDKVLGWNLDVEVNHPVTLPTKPVVEGALAPLTPCWPGGFGRNLERPAPANPMVVGRPDEPCIIPGPNGERPPVATR